MGHQLCRVAVALLLLGGSVGHAVAQADASHPGTEVNPAMPKLNLTGPQRQTIYTSISSTMQQETAPSTFHAALGAVVPMTVKTQPLPGAIVELLPELKGYEYAMVSNQVLLVDPKNKQVVEIIN